MESLWATSKALNIPLHPSLTNLVNTPYTISYVIRKRQQIDSINELPQEKRPPDSILWGDSPKAINDWFDKIFNRNKKETEETAHIYIHPSELEN